MNKLIIDNRTELSDLDSLELVKRVVNMGKISNSGKQYCYLSICSVNGERYSVSTDLNKKSERFVILKE